MDREGKNEKREEREKSGRKQASRSKQNFG